MLTVCKRIKLSVFSSCFSRSMTIMIFFFVVVPLSASAEIYTWVDENGKKHYGDRAPSNSANAEVFEQKKINTQDALKYVEEVDDEPVDPRVEERKLKSRASKWKKKYCSYVDVFHSHGRVNANGTREVRTRKQLSCEKKIPRKFQKYIRS